MSTSYISASKAKEVEKRAGSSCEYCLCPAEYAFDKPYHIDHVIAEVHGGSSELENLAYACAHCNGHKSSNLSTYLVGEDRIVNLFNPRKDVWSLHFELKTTGEIAPLSNQAKGTIRLLKLNNAEFVELRKALLKIGFI